MIPSGCGVPVPLSSPRSRSRLRLSVSALPTQDVMFTALSANISWLTGRMPLQAATATSRTSSLSSTVGTCWSSSSQAQPVGATVGNAIRPVAVWARVKDAANGAPSISVLSSELICAGVRTPSNERVTKPDGVVMAAAFHGVMDGAARTPGRADSGGSEWS